MFQVSLLAFGMGGVLLAGGIAGQRAGSTTWETAAGRLGPATRANASIDSEADVLARPQPTLLALQTQPAKPASSAQTSPATDQPPAAGKDTRDPTKVLIARVGDKQIFASEVLAQANSMVGGRQVQQGALAQILAQALDQIVDRDLLSDFLAAQPTAAKPKDVDAAVANYRQNLAAALEKQNAGMSVDEYLKKSGMSIDNIRKQAQFELSWQGYLKDHVTDKELEEYFQAHRKQLDGTEVDVSHILLRVDGVRDDTAQQATIERAKKIREEINDQSKGMSFADAARKYSIGPSRRQGGKLGLIRWRGDMVEAFSDAAFELEKGAISEPVTTQYGIHLIQATGIKPGYKSWGDVKKELQSLVVQATLKKLVEDLRGKVNIEFTGEGPYFDLKSRKLILPKQPEGSQANAAPAAPAAANSPAAKTAVPKANP